MAYLIDGHNLVGAGVFEDIRLSDEDDEAKLVARLKVWRSRSKGKITVIFDRGIPGGRDVKMGGAGVEVVFAADPAQADDLIRRRLHKRPKGLMLVSNDEVLLREAAVYGVRTLRGHEFVERMTLKVPAKTEPGVEDDVQLSDAEVAEWLALFGARPTGEKRRRRAPSINGAEPQAKTPRQKQSRKHKGTNQK